MKQFLIALAFAGYSSISLAGTPCDVIVRDDAGILDVQKVQKAAEAVQSAGAMVRIRTIKNLNGQTAPQWMGQESKACRDWYDRTGQNYNPNLIYITFAPNDKNHIEFHYGVQMQPRLGAGKWQDILRDRFVPQVKAGDPNNGFVNTLQEVQATLQRPSIGGKTVIHQATDYSGLWKVLGWGVFGAFVGAGGIFLYRRKQEKDALGDLQSQAKNLRAKCIALLNDLNDGTFFTVQTAKIAMMNGETKGDLKAAADKALKKLRNMLNTADNNLNGLDKSTGIVDKPNSDKALRDEVNLYRETYNLLLDAQKIKENLENEDYSAWMDYKTVSAKPKVWGRPQDNWNEYASPNQPPRNDYGYARPNPAPVQPQQPVVVNTPTPSSSFTDGLLVGSILSDRGSRKEETVVNNYYGSSRRNDDYGGGYDSGRSSSSSSRSSESSYTPPSSNDYGGGYDSGSSSSSSSDSGGGFDF